MNLADAKYREFGLVQDMLATPRVVASFDVEQTRDVAAHVAQVGRLFMTGEGSSRVITASAGIADSHARLQVTLEATVTFS